MWASDQYHQNQGGIGVRGIRPVSSILFGNDGYYNGYGCTCYHLFKCSKIITSFYCGNGGTGWRLTGSRTH